MHFALNSMYRLVIIHVGDRGEPIATPCTIFVQRKYSGIGSRLTQPHLCEKANITCGDGGTCTFF